MPMLNSRTHCQVAQANALTKAWQNKIHKSHMLE